MGLLLGLPLRLLGLIFALLRVLIPIALIVFFIWLWRRQREDLRCCCWDVSWSGACTGCGAGGMAGRPRPLSAGSPAGMAGGLTPMCRPAIRRHSHVLLEKE